MSEPLNVEKCKMCSDRIICNYTDGMMCQEKLIAEIKRLRGENEKLKNICRFAASNTDKCSAEILRRLIDSNKTQQVLASEGEERGE